MYKWKAINTNGCGLSGVSETIIGAIRAGRHAVDYELYQSGKVIIYDTDGDEIRRDERSIFTGNKWKSNTL